MRFLVSEVPLYSSSLRPRRARPRVLCPIRHQTSGPISYQTSDIRSYILSSIRHQVLSPIRHQTSDVPRRLVGGVQGYLAHKKPPSRRTLQQAFAQGPMVILGGWAFSYERGTPVRRPMRSNRSNFAHITYRGTSLTRKRLPVGPYSRTVPRALRWSWGVGVFLWARYPCTTPHEE